MKDNLADITAPDTVLRPLAPEGNTRCPACRWAYVEMDDDDCDEELEALVGSRRVCKCRFERFLNIASEHGWAMSPDHLAEHGRRVAARAGVPSRMWPSHFRRPQQAPTLNFGPWFPEWALRVFEIRTETTFSRVGGRGGMIPDAAIERVLQRLASDEVFRASALTTHRVAGEQVFAAFVLSGGTMPDRDTDSEA